MSLLSPEVVELIQNVLSLAVVIVFGTWFRTVKRAAQAQELAQRAADLLAYLQQTNIPKVAGEDPRDTVAKILKNQGFPSGPSRRAAAGAAVKLGLDRLPGGL